jgi:hypothetical protein
VRWGDSDMCMLCSINGKQVAQINILRLIFNSALSVAYSPGHMGYVEGESRRGDRDLQKSVALKRKEVEMDLAMSGEDLRRCRNIELSVLRNPAAAQGKWGAFYGRQSYPSEGVLIPKRNY